MKTSVLRPNFENDRVHGRQISFAAAFLLPAAKLLEAPALLSKYAAGDILLPALLHFLLQAAILTAVLFAATRSEISLMERIQNTLGKWSFLVYIPFGLFFLYAAILPLLDLEKFVYAAFFDTEPTFFSFGFFFCLSAFICIKGVKAIGRSADLCLFLFVVPFLALLVMSLWTADFTSLLPLFGTKFGDTMSAFTHSTPYFSDVILLLPLIACSPVKKKDAGKIMLGYGVGATLTLGFLAVFFGIYASLAPREHYAFSKIALYFPALSVVGRIDLIFVYLLSVVLLFFTCLPLQYATDFFARSVNTNRRLWFSIAINFCLFLFVLFANRFYNSITTFITKTPFIFWFIADIVPLFLLFLPRNSLQNKNINTLKKEKKRA